MWCTVFFVRPSEKGLILLVFLSHISTSFVVFVANILSVYERYASFMDVICDRKRDTPTEYNMLVILTCGVCAAQARGPKFTSAAGGAIYIHSGTLVLQDTVLARNAISVPGAETSTLSCQGGAIFGAVAIVSMLRCNMTSNRIFAPTGKSIRGLAIGSSKIPFVLVSAAESFVWRKRPING